MTIATRQVKNNVQNLSGINRIYEEKRTQQSMRH